MTQIVVKLDVDDESYTRWFGKESVNWSVNEEFNWLFLRTHQNWANDILRTRGHIFLNEIYASLGLSHTAVGAVVGWIHTDDETSIDFGCWDQKGTAELELFEGAIRLEFNVQGPIVEKLNLLASSKG